MTTTASESRPDTQRLPKPASDASDLLELFPVTLRLPETALTAGPDACEDWFWSVCMANDETAWQMELNAKGELELLPGPETLDGEDVLPGFTFAVRELIFESV